jgi:hypothetical protein
MEDKISQAITFPDASNSDTSVKREEVSLLGICSGLSCPGRLLCRRCPHWVALQSRDMATLTYRRESVSANNITIMHKFIQLLLFPWIYAATSFKDFMVPQRLTQVLSHLFSHTTSLSPLAYRHAHPCKSVFYQYRVLAGSYCRSVIEIAAESG